MNVSVVRRMLHVLPFHRRLDLSYTTAKNTILLDTTVLCIYFETKYTMASADTTPPNETLPDEPADMPSTMAASVVLDHLPRDAHTALEHAGELPQPKSEF